MLKDLPSLERLVRYLQRIPYLASKNIYRVALHFISSDREALERFCQTLLEAHDAIKMCENCCNFTEQSSRVCAICTSQERDRSLLCVVETWYDFMALERAGGYKGLYHILGGALSPLEGINVDDLSIDRLLKRCEDGTITEVIFATNPTPEGEATASYIASKMGELSLSTSKLASGVPIGSSLAQMDRVTVYKALLGRRPF